MNVKNLASLTVLLLATGLSLSAKQANADQLVLNSTSNEAIAQQFSFTLSQQRNSDKPPVDGRPDDRKPAGSHVK